MERTTDQVISQACQSLSTRKAARSLGITPEYLRLLKLGKRAPSMELVNAWLGRSDAWVIDMALALMGLDTIEQARRILRHG